MEVKWRIAGPAREHGLNYDAKVSADGEIIRVDGSDDDSLNLPFWLEIKLTDEDLLNIIRQRIHSRNAKGMDTSTFQIALAEIE